MSAIEKLHSIRRCALVGRAAVPASQVRRLADALLLTLKVLGTPSDKAQRAVSSGALLRAVEKKITKA